MEWLEKMRDELVSLKWHGSFQPYFYNEPTLDKRLTDIVRMFKAALPSISVMINTNCDTFRTAEDIARLIEAGINQMELNIYAISSSETHVASAKRREDQVRAMVEALKTRYPIDENLPVYRPIKQGQYAIRVVPKYHYTPVNRGIGLQFTTNRAGNIPGFLPDLSEPLPNMCVRPFRHLNIDHKGNAVLCCNDYYGEAVMGNVATQSLVEIWNSEPFQIYRLKLQNKRRDIFLCDVCDFSGGSYRWAVQHVTFGSEKDRELLEKNLRARESLFTGPPTLVKPKASTQPAVAGDPQVQAVPV